jgi:hypothetical protein
MSRKNLLTESEIRKFMKLANLNESYMPEADEDPTDLYEADEDEAEVAMDDEAAPMMDEPAMDEPAMDEPAPMMDEPMGDDAPAGGVTAEEKEEIIMGILDALQSLAGDDVEMNVNQPAAEPAVEPAMDAGMDDMDDMGDAEADEGGEEMADAALDDESGEDEMTEPVGDDEMIAEVARRVTARLAREQKVDDMANKLAENIFRRLASK